jgi:hypothetical protein
MKLEQAAKKPEDDETFKHKERLNVFFDYLENINAL